MRFPVEVWPYLAAVLLVGVGAIVSSGFASPSHLLLILGLASFLGLVAVGQTLVILLGGIDLSVSSTVTLAGVMSAAIAAGANGRTLDAVAAALLAGVAIGLVNGLGVGMLEIPPLVMTLGTTSVVQGLALIYTNGAPKGSASPLLSTVATGSLAGVVPYTLLLWAVVAALTIILLHRSVLGRWIYAVGHAPKAAYMSGVNVGLVQALAYTISGFMAALAGVLLTGYTRTSYLTIGDPYQLGSIAAVVVGGTSILGGFGSYVGTIAGAVIVTIIQSLLPVLSIPEAGRQIVSGLIILVLLLLYGRERAS
ncbi:MAG: ABC transporter permease [Firmicutes bacterium]|nr:ABC transporter permease [Bacillota bacterium]